jgi:hypothetical protein
MAKTHRGECFCGAVKLEVTGEMAAAGYCHCKACRHWSAGPVNAFSLWKPDQVRVVEGAEHIGTYARSPNSQRKWCKLCGGHLMTEHPEWQLVDVYAAILPDLEWKAGVHVNYASTVLPMKDGLPKLRDFPPELGGTGEAVAE